MDHALIVTPCFYFCRRPESNGGPTDYESVALPTELRRRFKKRQRVVEWCRLKITRLLRLAPTFFKESVEAIAAKY